MEEMEGANVVKERSQFNNISCDNNLGGAVSVKNRVEVSDLVEKQKIFVSDLADKFPRGTFVQTQASNLSRWIFWSIIVLTLVILVMWFFTCPDSSIIEYLAGDDSLTCKEKIEFLDQVRDGHWNRYMSVFEKMVTGLFPLFTLLIGYAFGTRENGNGD